MKTNNNLPEIARRSGVDDPSDSEPSGWTLGLWSDAISAGSRFGGRCWRQIESIDEVGESCESHARCIRSSIVFGRSVAAQRFR
ncbi:hypothetical protein RN2511_011360 [Rhodococcus sp. NKCM2511]|nr:hypothetical protein RN2511_011360 [Rhodococcus sp. NKCM2511]